MHALHGIKVGDQMMVNAPGRPFHGHMATIISIDDHPTNPSLIHVTFERWLSETLHYAPTGGGHIWLDSRSLRHIQPVKRPKTKKSKDPKNETPK